MCVVIGATCVGKAHLSTGAHGRVRAVYVVLALLKMHLGWPIASVQGLSAYFRRVGAVCGGPRMTDDGIPSVQLRPLG